MRVLLVSPISLFGVGVCQLNLSPVGLEWFLEIESKQRQNGAVSTLLLPFAASIVCLVLLSHTKGYLVVS